MSRPFHLLRKRSKLIVVSGFLVAGLSLISLVFLPLEYRADAEVLIIAKTRSGVDPYTVVKSAERVGENLVEVMDTKDFYQKVQASAAGSPMIDFSRFGSLSTNKERKAWNKALSGSVAFGTGVLRVHAYDTNPQEAAVLANTAADALVKHGWEYAGGDVTIKLVNDAVSTRYPARPDIPLQLLFGFLFGAGAAALLVLGRQ